MLKHLLLPLLCCCALLPLPLGAAAASFTELMRTSEAPSPLAREVDEYTLHHLENILATAPAFRPVYQTIAQRILRETAESGDTAFARFVAFRLACVLSQTQFLNSSVFAEWASLAPPDALLAVFWADALLASGENPRLALALLNTYADDSAPNFAVLRARALMQLNRPLDALHAIVSVFNPGSRHALPDPVLFALIGDIAYAAGFSREALLAWHKALRTYEAYRQTPDLDLPIADFCALFNVDIRSVRKKYRALRTLLK